MTMTFDQAAVDLLLAGDQRGLERLAAQARRTVAGKGKACARCGNDSYQVVAGEAHRECDYCGLAEGENPTDD